MASNDYYFKMGLAIAKESGGNLAKKANAYTESSAGTSYFDDIFDESNGKETVQEQIQEKQEKNKNFIQALGNTPYAQQSGGFFQPASGYGAMTQTKQFAENQAAEEKARREKAAADIKENLAKTAAEAQENLRKDNVTQQVAISQLNKLSEEEKSAFRQWKTLEDEKGWQTWDGSEKPKEVQNLENRYGAQRLQTWRESETRQQNKDSAEKLNELGRKTAELDKEANVPANAFKKVGAEAFAVAGSVAGGIGSGLEGIFQAGQRLGNAISGKENAFNTMDSYAGSKYTAFSSGVRQQNIEEINNSDAPDWLKSAATTGYQGVSSALDNSARTLASGGMGALSLGLAGLSSFGNAVSEASANGATPQQAIANGIVQGGLEVITEKIPTDNLLAAVKSGNKEWQKLVVDVLKAQVSEITEEEVSLIVGSLAEYAILQGASDRGSTINALLQENPNMTYEQAKQEADRQLLGEAIQTAIQTAISTGVSQTAGRVYGELSGQAEANRQAEAAQKQALTDANARNVQDLYYQNRQNFEAANAPAENETADNLEPAANTEAAPKTAVDTAVDLQKQNGKLSNSQAEAVIADAEAMKQLGIDPNGKTKSELRAEVKAAVENLANPQAETEQTQIDPVQAAVDIALRNQNAENQQPDTVPDNQAAVDYALQRTFGNQNQENAVSENQQKQPYKSGNAPIEEVKAKKTKKRNEKGIPKKYQETKTTKEIISEIKEKVNKIRENNKVSFEQREADLHFSDASLNRIAKDVADSTGRIINSDAKGELRKKLSDFYKVAMREDADTVSIEAQNLAEWIDSHSKGTNDGKSTVESVMLKLVENAENLSKEGALSGKAGEYQAELKETRKDDAKQAEKMQSVFEKTQKETDAEWERSARQAINDAKSEAAKNYKLLMDSQDTWMEAFKKMEAKYRGDIEGLQKALEKQAKENKSDSEKMLAYYNQMVAQYQRADQKISKLEKRIAYIKEMQKQKDEGKKRTEIKGKITEKAKALGEMLTTNDRKLYVMDDMKKAVSDALTAFDLGTVDYQAKLDSLDARLQKAVEKGDIDSVRKINAEISRQTELKDRKANALNALREAYAKIGNDNSANSKNIYSAHIADMIDSTIVELGDTPISQMDSNQLTAVYNMFSEVLTSVKKANKEFKFAKNQTVKEASAGAIEALTDKEDKKQMKDGIVKSAVTTIGINNMKANTAAEMVDSPVFQAAAKNLLKGEDAEGKSINKIKKEIDAVNKKHNPKTLNLDHEVSVKSENSGFVDIPTHTILALYEYSKSESAMSHITGEGIVLESKDGIDGSKKYTLSAETVSSLVDNLTDAQKAYADDYVQAVTGITADMINEVSMEDRGIEIATMENYMPLFTVKDGKNAPLTMEQYPSFMNMGALNARQNAANAIIVGDFRDLVNRHAAQAITYNSYAIPLDDFHRIMNYVQEDGKTLRDEITRVYGKEYTQYWDTLEKDLVSRSNPDNRTELINKLTAMQKAAATTLNLRTFTQQFTSLPRTFSVISPKYYAALPKVFNMNDSYAEFQNYAGVATLKELGMHDIGMTRSVENFLSNQGYDTLSEKAKAVFTDKDYRNDVISSLPGMADKMTWVQIWEASKRQIADTTNLTGEDLLKAAGELATKAIQETQVYDSIMSRSANMRSKDSGMKMATAFMAENTTTANMYISAFRDLASNDKSVKKQGAAKIGAALSAQLFNAAVIAAFDATFRWNRRDKDKDKSWMERFAGNMVGATVDNLNPASFFPYTKDIASYISGYDVERMDVSVLTNVVKKLNTLSALQNKDTSKMSEEELAEHDKKVLNAVFDFVGSLSAAGIGVNPSVMYRDFDGMIKTAVGMFSGDKKETTAKGIEDSITDALSEIPGIGKYFKETKSDRLYDAVTSSDDKYIASVTSQYSSIKDLNTALRTTLRNHDPRIREAAEAFEQGNTKEYERIMAEIKAEGHFDAGIIKGAVAAEVEARKPKENADYSDAQIDAVAQMKQWKEYENLPVSIQGKMEDLAYSKESFEKYDSPEAFAVKAFDSEFDKKLTEIKENWKEHPKSNKYFSDLDSLYDSAVSSGVVDKLIAFAEGTEKNALGKDEKNSTLAKYLHAKQNGMSTDTFLTGYKGYTDINSDEKISVNEKATNYAAYLDTMVKNGVISSKDKDFFRDNFYYRYTGQEAKPSGYDEMVSLGISIGKAQANANTLSGIKSDIADATGKTAKDADVYSEFVKQNPNASDDELAAALMSITDNYDPNAESPKTTELKFKRIMSELGIAPSDMALVMKVHAEGGKKNVLISGYENALSWKYGKGIGKKIYDMYDYSGSTKKPSAAKSAVKWYLSIIEGE